MTASPDIETRLARFLQRYRSWIADQQERLAALEAELASGTVPDAIADQPALARHLLQLAGEQAILQREWDAAAPKRQAPPELRTLSQAAAKEAAALREQLERLRGTTDRLAAARTEQTQSLRRNRSGLAGYHAQRGRSGGGFDRST